MSDWPTVLQSVILTLTGWLGIVAWWGFRRLVQTQDRIADQLVKLNGRLGRVETWQQGHEQRDNERFEDLRSGYRELRQRLDRRDT